MKTDGSIDPDVIAEDAQAWLPVRPSTQRLDAGDVVLRHAGHSPQFWYGSATRPRFDSSGAERRISEVRGWFASQGRAEFMWMFGDSATPMDLVDRLLSSGAVFDGDDGASRAMVLDREPPPGPEHLKVRRISSFDDYRVSMQIALEDADPETWAATEAGLEAAWAETSRDDRMYSFLALADGEALAFAQLGLRRRVRFEGALFVARVKGIHEGARIEDTSGKGAPS